VQISQDGVKLRMKSILTGPKVYRSNRHTFANALDVFEGQQIDATGIAITMGAGEIAFVGQPKADRKTIAARFPIISGLSRTDQ
jgi:hypothetical protein